MSKKTVFIYSTLTADNRYTGYTKGGGDLPLPDDGILIRGGSNMADKHGDQTTPGILTEVTDEELTALRENPVFQLHEKNGFITVASHKVEGEVAAANMETRSPDAPLQAEDFDANGPKPAADADEEPAPAPAPRGGNRRA